MKTKLIILGCGNSMGAPRIDGFWGNCDKKNKKNARTRCSAIILRGSNSILIDSSPDVRAQLLANNIKNISSVVYTHEHSDQTNGIFELRPFAFKKKGNKKVNFWHKGNPVNVYGNFSTIRLLKKRFDYCFKKIDIYPSIVKANIIKKKFSLGRLNEKIKFTTIQVKHGNLKVTGYIFNKTAYLSDCNDFNIIKKDELKNLNYLIIDCLNTGGNLAHFGLNDCLLINKALKPKKMILTNIHYTVDYNFLSRSLPNNIEVAYDGLKLNL